MSEPTIKSVFSGIRDLRAKARDEEVEKMLSEINDVDKMLEEEIRCLRREATSRGSEMKKRKKFKNDLTCKAPDRDVPGLRCGYPLPCLYHTVIIDVSNDPAEVRIPITAKAALQNRHRLEDIAAVLLIND